MLAFAKIKGCVKPLKLSREAIWQVSEDPYHTEFVSWRVDHFSFFVFLFLFQNVEDVLRVTSKKSIISDLIRWSKNENELSGILHNWYNELQSELKFCLKYLVLTANTILLMLLWFMRMRKFLQTKLYPQYEVNSSMLLSFCQYIHIESF